MVSFKVHKCMHFLILLFVCSCSRSPLEQALRYAGDNRPELEAVLEHYTTVDADSEKLAAARFLIENMPAHKSYRGNEIHDYYAIAGKVLSVHFDPRYYY